MKNTLQSLFDKYKNAPIPPAPFSTDELRNLIGSVSVGKPDLSHFLKSTKGKLIMTFSGLTIIGAIVGALSLGSFSTAPAQKLDERAISASAMTGNDFALQSDNESQIISKNDKEVTSSVLILNDNELRRLGIKKAKIGYEFIDETGFESMKKWQLKDYGYNPEIIGGVYRHKITIDSTNLKSEVMKYGGWDVIDYSKVVPIMINGFWQKENGNGMGSYSQGGYTPLMDINDGVVVAREIRLLLKECIKDDKLDIKKFSEEFSIKSKYPNAAKLVPIVLITFDNAKIDHKTVLWYLPTEAFVKALPDKYAQYIRKNYQIVDKYGKAATEHLMKTIDKGDDITGIEPLELTLQEMKKLNLIYSNGVAEIISESDMREQFKNLKPEMKEMVDKELRKAGYDPDKTKYIRTRHLFDHKGCSVKEERYNGWDYDSYMKISPIAIFCKYKYYIDGNPEKEHITTTTTMSDNSPIIRNNDSLIQSMFDNLSNLSDNFSQNEKLKWSNKKLRYNISLLVPVKLRIDRAYQNQEGSFMELIFWYVPTEDFLDALPKDKSERLRNEINLIAKLENGAMTPAEACTALKGETSVFDICRMTSDKYENLSVYPNPAKAILNLKFALKNDANIKIAIHDVSGKLVSVLNQGMSLPKGEHNIQLELKNVAQGAYLLSLTDETGEKAIRRIIVE